MVALSLCYPSGNVSSSSSVKGSVRASSGWGWVALLLFLWLGLLSQLQSEWSINPQYSYGFGVPLLSLYLILKSPRFVPSLQGRVSPAWYFTLAFLLALMLPIRLFQEANPDWRLVSWAYTIVIVSVTLLLICAEGGFPALKITWLPVCFILIAVPWPTPIEQFFIQGLMRGVASITVEIVNLLGIPAAQSGNLIELQNGVVGVSEACSGVRSFQATMMASIFLGHLGRFTTLGRFVLPGFGVLMALSLNVARTFFLTWITARQGDAIFKKWHDPAGFIVLGFSVAGLWLLSSWMEKRPKWLAVSSGASTIAANSSNSISPITTFRFRNLPTCLPLPSMVGALGWILCVEVATESWYRVHESKLQPPVTWDVNWPKSAPGFKLVEIAEESRLLLRHSSGSTAEWLNPSRNTRWIANNLVWKPGRTAAQLARNHTPESCLPAGGLKLVQTVGIRSFKVGGASLPFTKLLFESRGAPCQVYFCMWEDRAGSRSDTPTGADFSRTSRWAAVLKGERHFGQRVLEVVMVGESDAAAADVEMEKFLQQSVTFR